MSQFLPALQFTLNWEDPHRSYESVPDNRGFVIAGVNSKAWPENYAQIKAASQADRPKLVYNFYMNNFWDPIKIGGLTLQDLANRVFDEGVNANPEVSIKLLQESINLLKGDLTVDGLLGPLTLEAANDIDSDSIVAAFRTQRLEYYRKIIVTYPQFEIYFDNWEKRALA